MKRRAWLEPKATIGFTRQCDLVGVARSTAYASRSRTEKVDVLKLLLCKLIDEEYTRHPFYGSRKMVVFLQREGYAVNRTRHWVIEALVRWRHNK